MKIKATFEVTANILDGHEDAHPVNLEIVVRHEYKMLDIESVVDLLHFVKLKMEDLFRETDFFILTEPERYSLVQIELTDIDE